MQQPLLRQAILFVAAVLLTAASSPAATVRVAADTISIHANQAPLGGILAQLQEAGIRVAMDERINPRITADFDNVEIGQGIKRILTDCDYALIFEDLDGPDGKISRLSEVLVYKPGDRRALKTRPAPPPDVSLAPVATNLLTCIRNEILLRLRPGVTREQFRDLLLRTGATVLDGIPALGVYRLRLPPGSDLAGLLNSLAKDPLVSNAEPNLVYQPITPVRSGDKESAATARTAGSVSGPSIAILDSGFTPNASLEKAVVATLDATAPGQAITDPAGHGTQMAFLASGSVTPAGATPAAGPVPIIPIRAFDDAGILSGYSLMKSMVFAADNGARVISMSWGTATDSTLFNNAVAYARQKGAVLVAAAGNEPTGKPLYPAALPDVVAVAALTPDGNVWDQSNYGSFVKLAAPGFADLPVGYKGPPGLYGGTSIAAAYTANVIAQYLAVHPAATATDAVSALGKVLTPAPSAPGILRPEIPRLGSAAIASYLNP